MGVDGIALRRQKCSVNNGSNPRLRKGWYVYFPDNALRVNTFKETKWMSLERQT